MKFYDAFWMSSNKNTDVIKRMLWFLSTHAGEVFEIKVSNGGKISIWLWDGEYFSVMSNGLLVRATEFVSGANNSIGIYNKDQFMGIIQLDLIKR